MKTNSTIDMLPLKRKAWQPMLYVTFLSGIDDSS